MSACLSVASRAMETLSEFECPKANKKQIVDKMKLVQYMKVRKYSTGKYAMYLVTTHCASLVGKNGFSSKKLFSRT